MAGELEGSNDGDFPFVVPPSGGTDVEPATPFLADPVTTIGFAGHLVSESPPRSTLVQPPVAAGTFIVCVSG